MCPGFGVGSAACGRLFLHPRSLCRPHVASFVVRARSSIVPTGSLLSVLVIEMIVSRSYAQQDPRLVSGQQLEFAFVVSIPVYPWQFLSSFRSSPDL